MLASAAELLPHVPLKAAHLQARATTSLRHFLRGEEAVELAGRAVALMESTGELEVRVRVMHAQALARAGRVDQAGALAGAVAPAVVAGEDHSLTGNLAEILELQERLDASEQLRRRRVAEARASSDVSTLANAVEHLALGELLRGDVRAAHVLAVESLELAALVPEEVLQEAESAATITTTTAWLGRADEAAQLAERALDLARRCSSRLLEARLGAARGALALAGGDTARAIRELERVRDAVRGGGYRHPAFVQFSPELVEAYLHAGRAADAQAELAALREEAALVGTPWARAVAARCAGLLADEGYERLFTEALALHERSERVLEAARTRLAFGERLRRAGQRVRSREQLRLALDAFTGLGAGAWAERARAELAASGETIRRDESARDELTPQELQVVTVVAAGASNKEAAAQLFLSPKTIEFHLRNAYRKLGVRSRTQLVRALGEPAG